MVRTLRLPAFIVATLIALYAVVGFLVVPAVARSQAVSYLKETYALDLSIGRLRFNPFTLAARLEQVSLTDPGGDRLLAFDAFGADFELRSLVDRALVFKTVTLVRPYVHVHLRADGTLNLEQAFTGKPHREQRAEEQDRDIAPPVMIIGDVLLSGGDIHFTDHTRGRAFNQHFAPLDLHVKRLSTRPEDRSDLVGLDLSIGEGGRLTVAGDLSAIPTRFDVRLIAQDIPLAMFQPYLAERLPAVITDGALSFDLALSHGQAGQSAELALSGKAAVARLAVKLKERDDMVLAWNEVTVTGIGLDLAPNRLVIGEIDVRELDTSFKIYGDGRTNVGEVLRQATAEPRPAEAATDTAQASSEDSTPEASAFPFAVSRVVVSGSRLLYGDELIRPHVLLQIDQLAGEVHDITSDPATRTTFTLTGRVGGYGKADIRGAARLAAPKQDLKAKVVFSNVELTSFSPYAGKFAGYAIDKGKLFLDLRYTLLNSRIKGENHAVFDQFELGKKVDSEDATRLPVKFALSLLRDRDGRIDISLPVEGDVDSPGFRFGPLIVKALVNLITRIVTAPFDFIAGLFGGGPEMEYAVFEVGSTVLSAAERDKILPLSRALAARPKLILEVQGWADSAIDADVLRREKYEALLAKVAQSVPPEAVLMAAYDGFFGTGASSALSAELAVPSVPPDPAAKPPPVLDPLLIEAEMRTRLLAAQPVSEEELVTLAYARGSRVMDALVQDGGVEAERIFVRRGEIAKAGEGPRAKLILDAR